MMTDEPVCGAQQWGGRLGGTKGSFHDCQYDYFAGRKSEVMIVWTIHIVKRESSWEEELMIEFGDHKKKGYERTSQLFQDHRWRISHHGPH